MFKSLVWLDPEKILSPAGFEPRIFHSQGRCLNHLANEAVLEDEICKKITKEQETAEGYTVEVVCSLLALQETITVW